jgi:hypothetical protein
VTGLDCSNVAPPTGGPTSQCSKTLSFHIRGRSATNEPAREPRHICGSRNTPTKSASTALPGSEACHTPAVTPPTCCGRLSTTASQYFAPMPAWSPARTQKKTAPRGCWNALEVVALMAKAIRPDVSAALARKASLSSRILGA